MLPIYRLLDSAPQQAAQSPTCTLLTTIYLHPLCHSSVRSPHRITNTSCFFIPDAPTVVVLALLLALLLMHLLSFPSPLLPILSISSGQFTEQISIRSSHHRPYQTPSFLTLTTPVLLPFIGQHILIQIILNNKLRYSISASCSLGTKSLLVHTMHRDWLFPSRCLVLMLAVSNASSLTDTHLVCASLAFGGWWRGYVRLRYRNVMRLRDNDGAGGG